MAAQVLTDYGAQHINHNLYVLHVYCKCDTTKSTWTDDYLTTRIDGEIVCVDTAPGATAPQASYDPVLKNSLGIDIMGGALANRSATAAERAYPNATINQIVYPVVAPVHEALEVEMSGNNVSGADWHMYIYFRKAADEGLG